jgi:hypothetical protein
MARAAVDNDGGDANEATTPEVRLIHNTEEEDPILSKSFFFGRQSRHFFRGLACMMIEDKWMHAPKGSTDAARREQELTAAVVDERITTAGTTETSLDCLSFPVLLKNILIPVMY